MKILRNVVLSLVAIIASLLGALAFWAYLPEITEYYQKALDRVTPDTTKK